MHSQKYSLALASPARHRALRPLCLLLLTLMLFIPSTLLAQDAGVPFEDPNGLFSVTPPAGDVTPEVLRFTDVTSQELTGLMNDYGYIFVDEEDGGYALGVLLLLLEEDITTTADWLAFTDEFLAGVFEDLEILDSGLGGVQEFTRSVEGVSRGDHILVDLQEVDGVVMAAIGSVNEDTWPEQEFELGDAVLSVDWAPDDALAFLAGETADAPEAEMRFEDDEGVFSIVLPDGYLLDGVDNSDGYGLTFAGPSEDQSIVMGVLPAIGVFGVDDNILDAPMPLTDEEWDEFVTEFVAQATENVEPSVFEPGVVEHLIYLTATDEENQSRAVMIWLEEAEGLVGILGVIRQVDLGDENLSEDQFADMVASFAWSPRLAREVMAETLLGSTEPSGAPFVDPFGVVELNYPESIPLESVEVSE
ncbi:MAG: hypothetical protein HC802_09660 [Caldilineaceae bacterium]|nr:hypothetical protein [Caldilineaceae bacterium]